MADTGQQPTKGGDVKLTHLVNPRAFHKLPALPTPEAFEKDTRDLDDLSLEDLVAKQYYVTAAGRAERELTAMYTEDPTGSKNQLDADRVFYLWHVRMGCLMGARYYNIAREESRILGDLGADVYRDAGGRSVAPWDFRVAMVPIQSGGDNQAAVGRIYTLVREARAELLAAEPGPARDTWKRRLLDLGLYVGSTLICMGDYVTALAHLRQLHSDAGASGHTEFADLLRPVVALLLLQVGDTLSAREWLRDAGPAVLEQAVCAIADADYAAAAASLQDLAPDSGNTAPDASAISAQNDLAIAELHQGNLSAAINRLEQAATATKDASIVTSLLSNLFFLYDLRYDDALSKRQDFARVLRKAGLEALPSYAAFDRR